ncbi:hypothetical protein FOCC_FOCC007810 [Frankliniella occidentalis]|nr:hypothetical protein FOCC_FOCC007810 [Frankliniella occidentalis]
MQARTEKAAAWDALTLAFNSQTTYIQRDKDSLMRLWDNMKREARKSRSDEKQELMATGGGVSTKPGPSHIDEAVLQVLGASASGLSNPADGDSSGSLTLPNFSGIHVVSIEQENIPPCRAVQREDLRAALQQATCTPGAVGVGEANWGSEGFKPSLLYSPKPAALRVNASLASSSKSSPASSPTASPASSSSPCLPKRTLAEEAEFVKNAKRRRPRLNEDKKTALVDAKLALMNASMKCLEEEKAQRDTFFEIEKKKKELE